MKSKAMARAAYRAALLSWWKNRRRQDGVVCLGPFPNVMRNWHKTQGVRP